MMNFYTDILKSVSNIRTLSQPRTANWLFELAKKTDPQSFICEIGTYFGYLSAVLAKTGRQIITIDHMLCGFCDIAPNSQCLYLEVINTFRMQGVWDRIIPMPMTSVNALPMVKLINPRIELLYLDGDHSEDVVLQELEDYSKFVPVGGSICGDDCNPATGRRMESFQSLWNLNDVSAFYPQGVSMAVCRFFRNNDSFQPISDTPLDQFGFRRIK